MGEATHDDGFDLDGTVVLVTGASRGIGAAIAEAAAAEGARVACVARSTADSPKKIPGTIDATVERIRATGGDAIAVPADLTVPDDIQAMVDTTVERFGRLDVVVNNAAVTFVGDLDIDLRRHDLVMAINVQAPFLTVRAALPHLRAAGRGRIVSISSQAALRPIPGLMSYGMSKIALERMTVDLARQLHPDRIAVNCFRVDMPVSTEGTLYSMGFDADDERLGDWEPASVPAEGVVWMIRRPDDYTGWCESMWDLRRREGIMPSRAGRPFTQVPPLAMLQGLHDTDMENVFDHDGADR